MKAINEVSLSRVWKHINDDKTTVVIFTGFRDENSYEENVENNKTIASKLKNNGFGYFYVDGYWVENQGTSKEMKVKEDSIFTITKNSPQKLIELTHTLANNFKQEAILINTPDMTYILSKDGTKEKLKGIFKPEKFGEFYTQLKNKKKVNTFVFENERDGKGVFESFKMFIKQKNDSKL